MRQRTRLVPKPRYNQTTPLHLDSGEQPHRAMHNSPNQLHTPTPPATSPTLLSLAQARSQSTNNTPCMLLPLTHNHSRFAYHTSKTHATHFVPVTQYQPNRVLGALPLRPSIAGPPPVVTAPQLRLHLRSPGLSWCQHSFISRGYACSGEDYSQRNTITPPEFGMTIVLRLVRQRTWQVRHLRR